MWAIRPIVADDCAQLIIGLTEWRNGPIHPGRAPARPEIHTIMLRERHNRGQHRIDRHQQTVARHIQTEFAVTRIIIAGAAYGAVVIRTVLGGVFIMRIQCIHRARII